jgi:hypothetical protein
VTCKAASCHEIRGANVGAKDQVGLGIMDANPLPEAQLMPAPTEPASAYQAAPGLHRAVFARIVSDFRVPKERRARLEAGM